MSILNIQISITFQWYNELFNRMRFDPWNCSLKIRESIGWHAPSSLLVSQPYFWKSGGMTLTLPKWGLGSPLGLPKLQSLISGVKTPCIEVFFISMESYQILDVENGLAWGIWTFAAQVMTKKKVGNRPDLGAWRWSATYRWKALDESYMFALDLIPIGGMSKEL